MSKEYKNLKEIKEGCKGVDSCTSGSDRFMYKCFPFICEKLESIDNSLITLRKGLKVNAIKTEIKKLMEKI